MTFTAYYYSFSAFFFHSNKSSLNFSIITWENQTYLIYTFKTLKNVSTDQPTWTPTLIFPHKEKRHLILTLHWFCNILYFHLYTFNQNTSQRMSVEKDFLQTCDFFIQEKTALQHSFTWSRIIPLNVYSISTVNTIMYRICILIHSYFIRKCIGSNKYSIRRKRITKKSIKLMRYKYQLILCKTASKSLTMLILLYFTQKSNSAL